jgi:hypothetical protein
MVRNDVYFPARCLCSDKFFDLIMGQPELVELEYVNGEIFAIYDGYAREKIAEFVMPINIIIVAFKLEPYYGTIEIFGDIAPLCDDQEITSIIGTN